MTSRNRCQDVRSNEALPITTKGPIECLERLADEDISMRDIHVQDLLSVARVHSAAFSGSAVTLLGIEAVRRYYEWQLTGPHQAVALGAFLDGELLGFCFGGVFRGAYSGYIRKHRWFLTWRVVTHPWFATNSAFRDAVMLGLRALKRSGSPRIAASPDIPEKGFGILAIAVHPDHQGRGVGQRLMKHIEIVASGRGFRKLTLTVRPDNQKAVRFYEKLAWQRTGNSSGWAGNMTKRL